MWMGLWGKIYCYNERLEYLIISEMLPVYTQHFEVYFLTYDYTLGFNVNLCKTDNLATNYTDL